MGVRKRPELPTDDVTIPAYVPTKTKPVARFSDFPYDLLARYINHRVEFTVAYQPMGDQDRASQGMPWIVRKLT